MTEKSTDTELPVGESTGLNTPHDPFTALTHYLSQLPREQQVIAAIPLIVFALTTLSIGKLPSEKQWAAYLLSFAIAAGAWLFLLAKSIYKMQQQNKEARRKSKQLTDEMNRLLSAWSAHHEQMESLRKKAEKIQQSLDVIVREGRLAADNDAVLNAELLVREIEAHLQEIDPRVLELKQAGEVVKSPEENLEIFERIKQSRLREASEGSRNISPSA
jgi:hypothetical protein